MRAKEAARMQKVWQHCLTQKFWNKKHGHTVVWWIKLILETFH